MESKTPKSDVLIDEILAGLVPHTRICKWKGEHQHCEGKFEITNEDISFLKMLRVPAPNFCPTCRRIKRQSFMGFAQLFKRKCDVVGHDESIISVFSKECPFPVVDYKYFASDEFDSFLYRKNYEENTSPMEQLFSLRKIFPMPSFLNRDSSSINSDYSNGGRDNKNCYYTSGCYTVENAWYSNMLVKSKEIMDCRTVKHSDHVYSSLYSDHLYKSYFTYFSNSCTDSMFLFDCRNCINCFGCVNLRNAKYCIWNEQYSKEDYEQFIKSNLPFSRDFLEENKQKFWQLVKSLPINASRNMTVKNNVNGVMNVNSNNLYDVTESSKAENVRHADGALTHQNSMDLLYSGGSSLLYGTINIGSQSSNVRFSVSCKFSTNSEFIFNSNNLDNCFMCFGLQHKSYCILNKQYSPDEYFKIIDEIKSDMIKRGEYDDGLSFEFSAQAYNFSLAQISFPLTEQEIIKLGGYMAEEPESNAGDMKILSKEEVPQTIDEVSDDIVDYAIKCEVTARPFRITPSELQFYRIMKLPLPTIHPIVRMRKYYELAPIGKSYPAVCSKCGKSFRSLFDPKDGYKLYCEDCYKQEVY
ncbi:MAG: hypothetical protein NTZ44_03665 [Candidatus Nomurabacteria bacterium]|nr:hypothetical protein [Candidatus Nomurabacteria bacterium]